MITQMFYSSPDVLFAVREQMEKECVVCSVSRFPFGAVLAGGALDLLARAASGGKWGIARLCRFGRGSTPKGQAQERCPLAGRDQAEHHRETVSGEA